jgi:hypothetical protein
MQLEFFNNFGKKLIGRDQLRDPDVGVSLSFRSDFSKTGCDGVNRCERVQKFARV